MPLPSEHSPLQTSFTWHDSAPNTLLESHLVHLLCTHLISGSHSRSRRVPSVSKYAISAARSWLACLRLGMKCTLAANVDYRAHESASSAHTQRARLCETGRAINLLRLID